VIRAGIDIGSNTVRMLVAQSGEHGLEQRHYFRKVTRLAGDFTPATGLASASMERTLSALNQFAREIKLLNVEEVRAVGTAALRNAVNSDVFLTEVRNKTGITIDIISGLKEADLSCHGILSVLSPAPQRAVLIDIGGGSTEIIVYEKGEILQQQSLPLGVVRLIEDFKNPNQWISTIREILTEFTDSQYWKRWQQDPYPVELIGTAGTVTTLAALKLKMQQYDGLRVNNLVLKRSWLETLALRLQRLSIKERAELPGMEEGRADLIVPGLHIVLVLLDIVGANAFRVADAGLLEGLILE